MAFQLSSDGPSWLRADLLWRLLSSRKRSETEEVVSSRSPDSLPAASDLARNNRSLSRRCV